MTKKIVKISFAVYFLIGMHHVAPTLGGGGLYLPGNIIGWVFIATFIGIGFWHLSRSGTIRYSGFLLMFVLAGVLLILPMYYDNNVFAERTIYRLVFIFGGILFYAIMLQFDFDKTERKDLLYLILIATSIQSVVGIIQFYGIGPENSLMFLKERFPWGCFRQKNVMTSFMATGIGISLFFVNSHHHSSLSKIKLYFLYIMPFTGALIILLIPSKVGYVGLISAIILQALSTKYNTRTVQFWFIGLFLGILLGWATPHIMRTMAKTQTEQKGTFTNGLTGQGKMYAMSPRRDITDQMQTVYTRIGMWSTTWIMIKENPLTGVGYGSWEREWRKTASARKRNEPGWNYKLTEIIDHPHSELLLWVSEGGVAVFIAFIIFFAGYFFLLQKLTLTDSLKNMGLISPILLHTFFEFPFRISVAHWIVFLILIFVYDKPKLGYEIKSKLVVLIPAFVIPLVVYYNMGITYKNLQLLTEFSTGDSNKFDLLRAIKHPGPLYKQYEYNLLRSMLDMTLKSNDRDLTQNYIDRAEEFLEHSPHISVYQGLFTANEAMNRPIVAAGWKYKAQRMYPDPFYGSEWLYNDEDKKRKEEKEKRLAEKLKESESFLLNNKNSNPDIVKTSSGLQYRILRKGKGRTPKRKSKVKVNYIGPFFNLDEYNSFMGEDKVAEFEIYKLIDGWQEGMLLMKEGAEFEFFIHPKLGYGKQGRRGVPGNACLIFNVKLIKILE